ncbi:MAG: Rieske (2Fe-2S) protein [Acidimicrobiia bacterium]
MKQVVCGKHELGPGEIISGQIGPIPVVVIRAKDGALYALVAKCLHQGGPLDKGKLYEHMCPTEDVGEYVPASYEILKCPWHGYEYDIKTGCVIADPSRRLQQFTAREEGDEIVVEMAPPAPSPAAAAAAAST